MEGIKRIKININSLNSTMMYKLDLGLALIFHSNLIGGRPILFFPIKKEELYHHV